MTRYRDRYRIESTRMPGWDYAADGYYFVTICTLQRRPLFGEITHDTMTLSVAGQIAADEWVKSSRIRAEIDLDVWVIMPNHLHGIVVITNTSQNQQAGLEVLNSFGPLHPKSLQAMINQFKGAVVRRCRKDGFGGFAWQPRFYEHVIRSDDELQRARQYIQDNPMKWALDRERPASIGM